MPGRSRSSCEDWLTASIPSAFSLFLGHSALAQTTSTLDRLTTSGGRTTLESQAVPLDSGSTSISVEAGVQVLLEGSVGYSTTDGTCTFLGSGTYSAASSPSHGMLSYGVLDHTVQSTDVCNGHTFSYAVVYYTWTDTQSGATEDSFAVQWNGPDGLSGGPYDYTAELDQTAVGIAFNGQNIASTTQTVTVGQQISLTASPSNGQWVTPVDGSPVSGFSPSQSCKENTCFPPADFSSPNVTFYWYIPSENVAAATQNKSGSSVYDVNYKSLDQNGNSVTVTAHFQVVGPGLSVGGVSGGHTYLVKGVGGNESIKNIIAIQPPPAPRVECGVSGTDKAGTSRVCAQFMTNGDLNGGSVEYLQVLHQDNAEVLTKLGYSTFDDVPGDDTDTPPYYQKSPDGQYASDVPFTPLLNACALSVDVNFYASMYVLWKPAGAGSIFAPLGHFDWRWRAHTTRQTTSDDWQITTDHVTGTTEFHADSSYPTYTQDRQLVPFICPKGSK